MIPTVELKKLYADAVLAELDAMLSDAFCSGSFDRYFTKDEALQLLPSIQPALENAFKELRDINQRIQMYQRFCKTSPNQRYVDCLFALQQEKEAIFSKWIEFFGEQGIVVQDLEQGNIAFPCSGQSTSLLCWKLGFGKMLKPMPLGII